MSMSISAIDPISAGDVLSRSSGRPEALNDLAARFNQVMETQPYEKSHHSVGGPSAVTEVVSKGEAAVQHLFDNVRGFTAQAPAMNMQELASRSIQMSWEMASVQFHFTACTSIAQNCKSGMQTLMKNQ
jgi:type III secretion system HrpB2-like protein